MLLTHYKYVISLVLVIVFWKHIQVTIGADKLPSVARDFVMPVVLVFLLAELIAYVDRALDLHYGSQANLGPEFMYGGEGDIRKETQVGGYDPVGSGATNVTTQEIKNANYYARMNGKIANTVIHDLRDPDLGLGLDEADDEDSAFVNTPDGAALVENMDGGDDNGVDGANAEAPDAVREAATNINVPKLGSVIPANAVVSETNDYNNRLGCMTDNGKFLCSKPHPENPNNIVAPIPGGPWQPQSAATVFDRLSKGNYVPSTCDITKMELIRRGDLPQSAQ